MILIIEDPYRALTGGNCGFSVEYCVYAAFYKWSWLQDTPLMHANGKTDAVHHVHDVPGYWIES